MLLQSIRRIEPLPVTRLAEACPFLAVARPLLPQRPAPTIAIGRSVDDEFRRRSHPQMRLCERSRCEEVGRSVSGPGELQMTLGQF